LSVPASTPAAFRSLPVLTEYDSVACLVGRDARALSVRHRVHGREHLTAMLERIERGRLHLLASPQLEDESGVCVAFTDRYGGDGAGPYSSLNLSYNVGDEARVVASNRRSVSDALGIPPGSWVLGQQVHGTGVAEAGVLDLGRGASDHWSSLPRTDGLVTAEKGVALGVLTADCIPLVLVATTVPAIAVIHAGWRGVLSGIALRGLNRLARRSGVRPSEILAFIGPHIGRCCMYVGDEVARAFRSDFGDDGVVHGTASPSLDLGAACSQQLIEGGISSASIFDSGVCTMCSTEHFSYRRDPSCGRQLALACIRGDDDG
jgi:YfiH family protein